jgi:predicted dehydrogenase
MVEPPRSSPGRSRRLMLIGTGFWGRTWIHVVRASPHWELAALVDVDEVARHEAAANAAASQAACFASVADATDALRVDAALVVVPPAAHARVALEAIECGLHCLVEKPFTTTIEEARSVIQQAESAGRIVMVSQQYRHRAGARTVRALLDKGAIGPIGAVHITFANHLPVPGFQHKMEEPLLWDMAIHHFDLIRGVLGIEPVRVQATSFNPSWSKFAGNAAATVVFEGENGTTITYTGTWAPRGRLTGWDGVWEIFGEDGSIHWAGEDVFVRPLTRPLVARVQKRLFRSEWAGRRVKLADVDEADRLGSLAEFNSAIGEHRAPETDARDNIRSLALTVAAVDSARRRVAVDVAEVLDNRPSSR